MKYLVWDAWNNPDGDDPSEMEASDPEWAAERYVEREHANLEYPYEIEICVRDPDGAVTKWNVKAEPSFTFRATAVES